MEMVVEVKVKMVVEVEVPPGETHDGGSLANARRAGDDDVGHIPVFGEDTEPADSLRVTNNLLESLRPILLNPRNVSLTTTDTGLHHSHFSISVNTTRI